MSFSSQELSQGSGGSWDLFCNHDAQHHMQVFLLDLYFLQPALHPAFCSLPGLGVCPSPSRADPPTVGMEMRVQGTVSDTCLNVKESGQAGS